MSEKQKRALRELKIEAKPALVEKKKPDELDSSKVYYYKGAVYAIKGDEPAEWLNQTAPVSKKRKAAGEAEEKKEKRVRTEMPAADVSVEEQGSKRSGTGRQSPKPATTTAKRPVSRKRKAADISDDQAPAKRSRTAPQPVYFPFPPPKPKKRAPRQSRRETDEERHYRLSAADPLYSSRAYDFAVIGGHEEKSVSQLSAEQRADREKWAATGLAVHPLPQETLWAGQQQAEKKKGVTMAQFLRQVAALNKFIKDGEAAIARDEAARIKVPQPSAAKKTTFPPSRRDSFVLSDDTPPRGRPDISEDRAEEAIGRMNKRMWSTESIERERSILDDFFAGGQRASSE